MCGLDSEKFEYSYNPLKQGWLTDRCHGIGNQHADNLPTRAIRPLQPTCNSLTPFLQELRNSSTGAQPSGLFRQAEVPNEDSHAYPQSLHVSVYVTPYCLCQALRCTFPAVKKLVRQPN